MRRLAVFVIVLLSGLALLFTPAALADSAFSGGKGTREEPFLLSTAADLRLMRLLFATSEAFAAYQPCFRLTDNIRLNQGLNETFMWRPIPRFTGELDGAGHTVTGMYVLVGNAVPLLDGAAAGNGFIGELAAGARVHDLTFSGCVEVPQGETLSLAGGIACVNRGEIAGCISYVTVIQTAAVRKLQSSGIAAVGEGALLGCTDQSRFYLYPEASKKNGEAIYTGISCIAAVRETALQNGCIDASKNAGKGYPTVWNLFEPTPTPLQTPSPVPTPSPIPTHTPPPTPSPTPMPTPTLLPTPPPTEPPIPTNTFEPTPETVTFIPVPTALSALDSLKNNISAIGNLFSGDLPVESDFQYAVNPDGRSVTIMGYRGDVACLTVPDTIANRMVTHIGSAAFAHNPRLLELFLPDRVTDMASDALIDCPNLYRLHLPAALQHVSMDAVRGCVRLIDIDMPASAVSVTGRFPQESPCVVAWTSGNAVAAMYCAAHGLTVREGSYLTTGTAVVDGLSIRFRSGDTGKLRALYPGVLGRVPAEGENLDFTVSGLSWADTFLSHSPKTYDHDLAKISLGLSLAVARSSDGSNGGAAQTQNIGRAMLDLGFSNLQCTGYDESGAGGTLSVIGSKHSLLAGKPTTLIAVVIGDGVSEDAWQSDLNLTNTEPSSSLHNGYEGAADQIRQRLQAYLRDIRVPGIPVKLWVTGFGRGGAIGNLLAARCIEEQQPDVDCFGYSFANPSVTAAKTEAQAYPGLFSIVSAADPVAALPLRAWGYGRYGQTLELPSAQSLDPQIYEQVFTAMQAAAARIDTRLGTNDALFSFMRMKAADDRLLMQASRFLEKVMTYAMPTPAIYHAAYSRSLLALWRERDSKPENEARAFCMFASAPLLQLAQSAPDLSLTGTLDTCYRLGALNGLYDQAKALAAQLDASSRYPTVASVLRGEASEDATLSFDEIATFLTPALEETIDLLVANHSPEYYISWLMSASPDMLHPALP